MLKSEWVDDSADDSDCEIIFESSSGVLFKVSPVLSPEV